MTNTLIDTEIQPSDISFVVQGGLAGELTKQCLQSIRTHFPGAAIILSTWAGSDTTGMDYDELVLSEDPGFFRYNQKPDAKLNNVNRQIVSTRAGMLRVQTPYVFKIRTDFLVSGNGFLRYWNAFPASGTGGGLFRHKVLACCYFTRNPRTKETPLPFHLSDLAFFGETQDLRDLFDIPLMQEDEAYWYEGDIRGHNRYAPEQHIFINFLRRRGRELSFRNHRDATPRNIEETEAYFASNFVLLSFDQFCLSSPKKHFSVVSNPPSFYTCYTHNEWLGLYKQYADPAAIVPARDADREMVTRHYRRYKLRRPLVLLATALVHPKQRRRQLREAWLEYLLRE